MRHIGTLTELKQGHQGVVVGIDSNKQAHSGDSMRRRLQDLGLIEGTEVVCVCKSPLGDPKAFGIRGAVIALRAEDSSRVRVQWEQG
ncbi:MAG: ferrous iron transport protein A [Peptococcaceae bacterium]|nr:ferrous iron transport protein A [Peptococcaceae bacterium]